LGWLGVGGLTRAKPGGCTTFKCVIVSRNAHRLVVVD
jgi:hypothetical protein